MSNPWQDHAFIQQTASANGWQYSELPNGAFLIQGVQQDLAWSCALEQSYDSEYGHTSIIDWVCPQLAVTEADIRRVLDSMDKTLRTRSQAPIRLPIPQLHVHWKARPGGLKNLLTSTPSEPELIIDDTAGIIDPPLRARLTQWPEAYIPNGRRQPARLSFLRVEPAGFRVRSVQWWASAPALTHQIRLGIDLAARLRPHFSPRVVK